MLVTQTYPTHKSGTVQPGREWGMRGPLLLNSTWRVEGFDNPGIKAREITVTTAGATNVFIADLARPPAVETFMECFGNASSSLRSGEKVILKQRWANATNFLKGVQSMTSLAAKDKIVEAILEQDAGADADDVLQQLSDYAEYLLDVVRVNELVVSPGGWTPLMYCNYEKG